MSIYSLTYFSYKGEIKMERIFENYLNDIYVDVLNFIEDTNLNIKFLHFYRKKPNLLVCELFDENQENTNQFRHICVTYSLSAMYQYLSDNLKVRILIGIIRAKYFMEENETDKFDCIYYHQSNVMDFPNSIHL